MWQQAVHGCVEAVAAGAAKRGEELGGGHRPGGRRRLLSATTARQVARAAAATTAWIMNERCLRVAQLASAPASKRSPSSSVVGHLIRYKNSLDKKRTPTSIGLCIVDVNT